MSGEDILRESDKRALSNTQYISRVQGKNTKFKKSSSNLKAYGAAGFLTLMIVIGALLFSSGNIVPSAISQRLIEETDVQYADAVAGKELVFQQALYNGEVPDFTASILKKKGILVGYEGEDGFVEATKVNGELLLKLDGRVVEAKDFIKEIKQNYTLYEAFNEATYSRAAYYYDESAKDVFKKIGTNRNNYTGSNDLNDVMNKLLGEGSDMNANTVVLVEKQRKNEQTGEVETYYEYEMLGENAHSDKADDFIRMVGEKNTASSSEVATLNAANSLNTADTISKEQKSSLYYLGFMENISKMKAGDGNTSSINEAMNHMFYSAETEVVDIKTGEAKKVTGSPLESPSLYALLSGNKLNIDDVAGYASDRILKLTENKLGVSSDKNIISGTITSSTSEAKGSIGNFTKTRAAGASLDILGASRPIINGSLVENSYETIKGVKAGEYLVEGAINVGKELAKKSGASAGDSSAVLSYTRLNNDIVAMDAEIDRKNRSPFDITSRNTFLGSIIYNFAISQGGAKTSSILSGFKNTITTVGKSIINLLPSTYADSVDGFLATFGDCKTYSSIGAVGSAGCSQIATFDTTTLNDPFNDQGFVDFVNSNTTLNPSGTRTINKGSALAHYILYNDERETPLGVTDGGIQESILKESSSIPYKTDILDMVKTSLNVSEDIKKISSGEEFVNSSKNEKWDSTYKYAQRYVSLARASEAMKHYSGGSTAYNNIRFFEGEGNPVVAFLNEYYKLANK